MDKTVLGQTGGMISRWQDDAIAIDEPKERGPNGGSISARRCAVAVKNSLKLGKRVLVKVIDVAFFQSRAQADRLRKRAAFFNDRARLRFLQG